MKQEIITIYEEILSDLETIVKDNYFDNADGFGHKAKDDYEAIKQAVYGSLKPSDAAWLKRLIKNEIKSYLEIGSYIGISFKIINILFDPKFSFSIDPNIPHRVFHNPRNIFHFINKKLNYEFKDAFWCAGGNPTIDSSYFKDIRFDLIFIDGDHLFDSVKRDFFESLKILSDKGTILLHDTESWRDVKNFIQHLKLKNFFIECSSTGTDGLCAIKPYNI